MTITTLKAQQGEPGWYYVEGEQPVTGFTDAILDHDHAGNREEIFWHMLFILYGKWTPADPANPNKIRCCTGTVHELSISGDGDICIELTPDPSCQNLLAPGQTRIECELPWGKRNRFRPVLRILEVGMRVRICGYFVKDSGHGATIPLLIGGSHELHPVTSIAPV